MRFLLAGASGFLGTHLRDRLLRDGHEVVSLTRHDPVAADQAHWDPYGDGIDRDLVEGADIVVNLAGSPTLGNPHSKTWARNLRHSRVTTTRVLAEAIGAGARKPAFLAGNGISVYGDHGDEVLTEDSGSRGDALLTSVTREWQEATAAAGDARVCVLRTAPVYDRSSPPLKQQRLQFLAGLGGRLGDGRQHYPVVSLRDWVGAVVFLAGHDDIRGPVNLCCEQVPTNAEFTAELARQLHRPAFLHVPAFAVRAAAGAMAPEVLGSLRTVPRVLLEAGYEFHDPTVREVLETALASLPSA